MSKEIPKMRKTPKDVQKEDQKDDVIGKSLSVESTLEGADLRTVRIHQDVITVIARLATLKVPGVVEMSATMADGFAGIIRKNMIDRGIKVSEKNGEVGIELQVVLEYGIRIPQVCLRIQNDVQRAVEDMTGRKVKKVDVVIRGVKMPIENQNQSEEKIP